MSIRALNWAWEQRTGSPTAKAILAALADLADETHSCFPSTEWIADRAEVSLSTVQRYLKQLEESGYLSRERRYIAFGKRSNDRFVLPVGQLMETSFSSLDVKLTSNDPEEAKDQVKSLNVNLTSNGERVTSLDVNCDIHIDTPEKIDKSIFIEEEPPAEAAPRPDMNNSLLDTRLWNIHPTLSVNALSTRLKVARVEDIDVLRAVQTILARASRTVHNPLAFVAKAIDATPDAWGVTLPGFEPGQDVSGKPSLREVQRANRDACNRNEHQWGPDTWAEIDRAYCIDCGTARRNLDPVFRELQDEHDQFTIGGDRNGQST
ncbi:helix-turn-helix domain-containing protein [Leucobacter sp. UT-8R-CII-1-4]|uniref:helix-turn-helix domain-containing protein n=1 Tax=Leucobacter sp. UT-8R-CII-1-4 TaxID=3040075 RepID=UPI0024A80676|nr:helix-turn-helix domain-containing protein [Leucobacter sp. UT-8R-CII-1-4]MDI6022625.1 helix-turn-helix domain-containing protein [Leucobacter sp. UT-8R-CII-1-4]